MATENKSGEWRVIILYHNSWTSTSGFSGVILLLCRCQSCAETEVEVLRSPETEHVLTNDPFLEKNQCKIQIIKEWLICLKVFQPNSRGYARVSLGPTEQALNQVL